MELLFYALYSMLHIRNFTQDQYSWVGEEKADERNTDLLQTNFLFQ